METIKLYKFLSKTWAMEAIKKKRLKATTLDDINDPFEFNNVQLPDAFTRGLWRQMRKNIFGSTGILCLSDSWSNPVIWSHYADNHKGAALEFRCTRHIKPHPNLFKVRYQNKLIEPDTHQNKLIELDAPLTEQMRAVAYTKYKHWQYENEWRIIQQKVELETEKIDGKDLFFKPFNQDFRLTRVIIGAESGLTTSLIHTLHGNDQLPVDTARLSFKKFKVVRQKAPHLQK